jgi:hypothetical protein
LAIEHNIAPRPSDDRAMAQVRIMDCLDRIQKPTSIAIDVGSPPQAWRLAVATARDAAG